MRLSASKIPRHPSERHEERRAVLDAIAVISGFTVSGHLPDGSIPDVFRVDPRCGAVFLADAKETETPGNRETQDRLSGYMRWFAHTVRSSPGSVFAICVGDPASAPEWQSVLRGLAIGAGLPGARVEASLIDLDLVVISLRVD